MAGGKVVQRNCLRVVDKILETPRIHGKEEERNAPLF
jgi:hypothetical protein